MRYPSTKMRDVWQSITVDCVQLFVSCDVLFQNRVPKSWTTVLCQPAASSPVDDACHTASVKFDGQK